MDRKMGTEIFRTRANSVFFCQWFRSKAALGYPSAPTFIYEFVSPPIWSGRGYNQMVAFIPS